MLWAYVGPDVGLIWEAMGSHGKPWEAIGSLMRPKPLKKASDSECLPSSEGQCVCPPATWINTNMACSMAVLAYRDVQRPHMFGGMVPKKKLTMWRDYIVTMSHPHKESQIRRHVQLDEEKKAASKWGSTKARTVHVPWGAGYETWLFLNEASTKPEKRWHMTGKGPKLRVTKAVMLQSYRYT